MKKIFSHRKAFSLVELFIVMIVIAIFTSFITSNITSQHQTAKQETEKLEAYITELIRKADRRHVSFTINFSDINKIYFYWRDRDKDDKLVYLYKKNPDKDDEVIMTPGFSISEKSFTGSETTYSSSSNEFSNNGLLKITRDIDKTEYYLIFYKGRIRASETKGDQ